MRDAMGYEYLIRKAYGCGRQRAHGADADFFRKYERELAKYNVSKDKSLSPISNQSEEELAFNADIECGKISSYIENAISKVLNKDSKKLSEDQKVVLENCIEKLLNPTKEKIEDSIEQANKVFSEIGLKLG